ncbi:MAG: DUF4836 family protein [Bacteroidota bacterium]
MKIYQSILFTFLLATLSFFACKKDSVSSSETLSRIPESATGVSAINLKNLLQKADFEEVKKMEFYREMKSKASEKNPAMAEILENPMASGVDLEKKIYLFTDANPEAPEEMVTCILVPLRNASDFAKMMAATGEEIGENGGLKFIANGRGDNYLAWNDQLAIFGMTNGKPEFLTGYVADLHKTGGDKKSIASNKDLQKALTGDHDFAGWFSTDALLSQAGFALTMLEVEPEALKNNHIHGYADFEKGKVVGHSDFYINKDLGENFIGRFFKEEVKADFSEVLPKENLAFAAVAALDLRGIDEFLSERPQSQGMAEFMLKEYGVKRQDFVATFGGDLLVAGFGNAEKSETNAEMLVATSVKDSKKAREFLQKVVADGKLKEVEKDLYSIVSFGNEDFSITINKGMGKILLKDNYLVFSKNDALLAKIKSGLPGSERAGKEVFQNFDDQTVAGWLTFDVVQKMFGESQSALFKDLKFKVNGNGADFIMQTADPNENSLNSLFKMMNEAYKRDSEKEI